MELDLSRENVKKYRQLKRGRKFKSLAEFHNSQDEGSYEIHPPQEVGPLDVHTFHTDEPPSAEPVFGGIVSTQRLSVVRLRNAVIAMPQHIVWTEDGQPISDLTIWRGKLPDDVSPLACEKLSGDFGAFTNNNFMNYSHWHVESLPALHDVEAYGLSSLKYLRPPLDFEFQKISGDLTSDVVRNSVELGRGCFRLETLTFLTSVDHSKGRLETWPLPLKKISADIVKAAHSGVADDYPERIFLSRADSSRRVCLNERDLQDGLERIGFTTIVASNLTYYEQVRVFRNAKIIVAPHGAGITNMMFCKPSALIIEIQPAQLQSHAFLKLAPIFGTRHSIYRQFTDDGSSTHSPWSVNARGVTDFVVEAIKKD